MTVAAIEGQDLVLILGAYTALVVGLVTPLLKVTLGTRKSVEAVNKAVNNRPDHEPSIYELAADLTQEMRDSRRESRVRHLDNRNRLDKLEADFTALKRSLNQVAHEITTLNGSTLAMLGDATESRRISHIPEGDRTTAEQAHVDRIPDPPEDP